MATISSQAVESTGDDECEFRVEEVVNDLDLSRLSEEVRKRLNMSKVAAVLRDCKSLDILLCGKTGAGKSTLVNGLIGIDLMPAKEGSDSTDPCTAKVTDYKTTKDRIDITIWDTPGLMDGTEKQEEYLQDIQNKCPSVHLKLFCVNCNQTRFLEGNYNHDFLVMQQFTAAFGTEFWENVVIVFTLANVVESLHPHWKKLPPKEKRVKFAEFIEGYKNKIHAYLKDYIKLPEKLLDKMKMIPAGHYEERMLPDRDYWLSNVYFECLNALPSPNAKGALLKLNLDRFRVQSEVIESEFKKQADCQPIVVSSDSLSKLEASVVISESGPPSVSAETSSSPSKSQTTPGSSDAEPSESAGISSGGAAGIGGSVGVVVGGGLGFIGLLGGPLAFATVPAGAAVGSAVGAGLGYFTKRMFGSSTDDSSTSESTGDKSKSN